MAEEHFAELRLPIPQLIYNCSKEEQLNVFQYLNSFNETQKIAYKIAISHLGSSYNLCRSNGYKEWCKKNSLN
jgi:hypothetical protein